MESFEEYGRDELMPILISSIGNGVATSQTYPPKRKSMLRNHWIRMRRFLWADYPDVPSGKRRAYKGKKKYDKMV